MKIIPIRISDSTYSECLKYDINIEDVCLDAIINEIINIEKLNNEV